MDAGQVLNQTLAYWKKKNFKGKDVGDILSSKLYIKLNQIKNKTKLGKYIYYPFLIGANKFPNTIRKVFGLNSNRVYPQAYANMIRGLVDYHKVTGNDQYKDLALQFADELLKLRNKNYDNYCWGQPYKWPSNKVMQPNVPRTTVSSQVAAAFLDIYEQYGDNRFLKYAQSICQFYIEDLNYTKDDDGHFCFSYTTEDHYHVHNPSILAASILIRTHYHDGNPKWKEYGLAAANFTVKHQNEDGSWYYRSKPDKVKKMIDNYHTGFVLEGLKDIKTYSNSDFQYQESIDHGLDYYLKHFFGTNYEPKYRPDKIYPVDIQACAQTIITLSMFKEHHLIENDLNNNVMRFTLDHFYNNEGRFYYRLYAQNKIDKNSFIRWGDSWMIRAIGLFEKSNTND